MTSAETFFRPEDEAHIRQMYEDLHRIPELETDLPKTVAYVKRELEELGIPYTEKYAPGSIVAYLGYPERAEDAPALGQNGHAFTIALRADMDALPIQEETGLPYASIHPGKMHACGHDAHTAMLLGAARALMRAQKDGALKTRVKLLFQPDEEGDGRGAELMARNGVLDDVDEIYGQHCQQQLETGKIGWHIGPYMAACHIHTVTFHGKSAHATLPQNANDALLMGVKAVNDIYLMQAKELDPFDKLIICVGSFHAGTAHNIIASSAKLEISVRTFSEQLDQWVEKKIRKICTDAAEELEGTVTFEDLKSSYVVDNAPELVKRAVAAAKSFLPEDSVVELDQQMGSEDFSCFMARRPGCFTRIGTGNVAKGCTGVAHTSKLILDEDAFLNGSKFFAQLALSRACI